MRNFVVYKFSFKLTTTLPKEVYCNNLVCTSYSAQNTFWVSARQLRQAMAKTTYNFSSHKTSSTWLLQQIRKHKPFVYTSFVHTGFPTLRTTYKTSPVWQHLLVFLRLASANCLATVIRFPTLSTGVFDFSFDFWFVHCDWSDALSFLRFQGSSKRQ